MIEGIERVLSVLMKEMASMSSLPVPMPIYWPKNLGAMYVEMMRQDTVKAVDMMFCAHIIWDPEQG